MNYEDYKVEELEDESVKKSNIAKTAGIAAGMGIIGAGAAVAATTLTDDDEEVPVVEETDITSDDLVGGASQGAQNTTINEKHVVVDDTKGEQNLTTDQTVAIVDGEGNLLASQTTGTIDGKAYVATDYNGDGMADEVFYDLNGDGVFTPNEGTTLNGAEQFSMSNLGQASQTTVYVQGNEGGSEEGHGTNGEGGNSGGTEGEDSQFTVDQTTAIVDAEGNLLASQTAGTMDGKVYVVTDYDGDGMADELYYDVNGDGEFTPDEGGVIEGDDQFAMSDLGKATNTTVYVQGNEGGNGEEPLPGEDEELPDDTDIDDIHNDEDGQLNEGNEGEGDYADNNDDYNNDEDVSDFA